MLSLVLPTYNEAENLSELLPKVEDVLKDIPHEIIIVDDDSPDGTWRVAQELSEHLENVHVIRRIGRRGLSSAVVEGFLAAKGDVLAVADADGQHDLTLLPKLYEAVKGSLPCPSTELQPSQRLRPAGRTSSASAQRMERVNIAIGSRYIAGGSVVGWDERRHALSRFATKLAIALCKVKAADPMSGFFAIDRQTFETTLSKLNPKGFKILLDFLVHVPKSTRVKELPFTFGTRMHGESKLSRRVQIEFLEYLYDVTLSKWIPLTFVKYCIVGSLGVIVHLAAYLIISRLFLTGGLSAEALAKAEDLTLLGFSVAVIGAIEAAIVFNFLLNNVWTFAHARLKGFAALVGFVKFNAACAVGAVANYGTAAFLFSRGWPELVCVVIGAFVGTFWNYTMNRLITWRA